VDRYYPDFDTDYVIVDNYGGAYNAVMHLIKHGHRKIAHLYGAAGSANDARLQGYLTALGESGIVYRPAYVRKMSADIIRRNGDRFEPDMEGGYQGMLELLALPEPPTAVFAGNDYQAIGAMRAIKEANKKVPDEVAIIGFDDLKFSSLIEVPLTTVRQPKYEIGQAALRILLEKMKHHESTGKVGPYRHEVLNTELVLRASCGTSGKR
jgi:DNA-binding LacI/PurR family transcriptional regulator